MDFGFVGIAERARMHKRGVGDVDRIFEDAVVARLPGELSEHGPITLGLGFGAVVEPGQLGERRAVGGGLIAEEGPDEAVPFDARIRVDARFLWDG